MNGAAWGAATETTDAAGPGATDVARVRPAARLRGTLRMPGDKSISHRALILATLAQGSSVIQGAGDGARHPNAKRAFE